MGIELTIRDAIYPQALQLGDKIAVISPAAPSTLEQFEKGITYLESMGFQPVVMPNAKNQYRYFAGTDRDRLLDLHNAFLDPSIKGIISARGGYGCMRLLPYIDWEIIKANPKVFIGFSDLTALLMPMFKKTGLVSFHGPMLTSNLIEEDGYTQDELWKNVMGKAAYPYLLPNKSEYTCIKKGACEGTLLGGNLSLLASLCGTEYQPCTKGTVLFIEDWHEKLYSLDRKLMQLKLAGMFDSIAGLVFCDFVEMEEYVEHKDLTDLFSDITDSLSVPVGYGFSCGHGDHTVTLPIGAHVRFESSCGHLEILSSTVLQASFHQE